MLDYRTRASEAAAWCYQNMPHDSMQAMALGTDVIKRAIDDCVNDALWSMPEHIKDEELKMSFNLRSEAPMSAFEPAIKAYARLQVKKERDRIIDGIAQELAKPNCVGGRIDGLAYALRVIGEMPNA